MAALSETVFTDAEILGLIAMARGTAAFMLGRNRQEQYEQYEKLATALQQVVSENTELRKRAPDATGSPQEKPENVEQERPAPGKRERVRNQQRPGPV